jgi:hypothetical protein
MTRLLAVFSLCVLTACGTPEPIDSFTAARRW